MSRSVSGNSSSARQPSEPPSAKLPWLIAHTDDGRTSQPVPASPPVSVRTDRGVTVSARGSDGRVQSAAPLSSFASDRDRFHSRVERDMPHGGGMVTLPVRDTRADDDPSSRGRLRLQGDSSMNTGMECGENVKARATTRFHWCTLPVTRDAAEAALLPSRSRKPGTGTGHRLAFQTGQGTKGKVCWLRRAATVQAPSPDSRRPSLGAASRYSPDAAVSRRALSRVNAVVPARRLTRAAAEARMRRGRWSRGRATS